MPNAGAALPLTWWAEIAAIFILCAVVFWGLRKSSFDSNDAYTGDDPTRRNVLRVYILAAMVLGPGYTAFFGVFDAWWTAIGPMYFGVATFTAFFLHRKGHHRQAALLLVFALWTAPAWCAVFSGGIDSPLVIWLAPSAFIAAPLLGKTATLFAGTGSAGFVVLLGVSPAGFPNIKEMQSPTAHLLLAVACGTTAIMLLAYYGYSASASYESSKAEMAERNAQLAETSEQLDRGNTAMRRILDNVLQGFMTVDGQGHVEGQVSKVVTEWFGELAPGVEVWSLFAPHDENVAMGFELGFEELADGWMPKEVTLEQLPKRMRVDERELRVELRVLDDEGYLVVITDITDAVSREKAEAMQQDVLALMRHMRTDKNGVQNFLQETQRLMRDLSAAPELKVLKRAIHTVKGNAGMFDQSTVAKHCHELETHLAEVGELSSSLVGQLDEAWETLAEEGALLLNDGNADVRISKEQLADLAQHIEGGTDPDRLVEMLQALTMDALDVPLGRVGRQAERLVKQLGKKADVVVDAGGHRKATGAMCDFFSSLVHVVRNAVDHGLETPQERIDVGKPEQGRLTLAARREGEHMVVSIADDGRGIDWERIGSMAAERGLPHATHDDKVRALFADGLSTKDEVTELSGRGVGSAAVLAEVEQAGGRVDVHSELGVGTTFSFYIPHQALAVSACNDDFERTAPAAKQAAEA